jgi:hypothetical protein
MQVQVNQDTSSVLEFMQANIPASRLVAVANSLPLMAKLLWDGCPQEPVDGALMVVAKPTLDCLSQ